MNLGVTFAHPNSIFLTESELDRIGCQPGDPIQVEFESGNEIAGRAKKKSELDLEKEKHAMFFTIPDVYEDLPDKFEKFKRTFDTRGGDVGRTKIDLGTPKEFELYLEYTEKFVSERNISQADVVVGNDILQYEEPGGRREDLIDNQLVQAPRERFLDILEGELPGVESVGRFDGDIEEPSNIFFCTNTFEFSSGNTESFVEDVKDLKYMMTVNLLFPTPEGAAHGPLPKEIGEMNADPHGDADTLLRVSDDNIEICSVHVGDFHLHSESRDQGIPNEAVPQAIVDATIQLDEDDFLVYSDLRDRQTRISINGNFEIVVRDSDGFKFFIKHATDEELEKADEYLEEIKSSLGERVEDTSDDEIHFHYYLNDPLETVKYDKWVLDTNSVYRQSPLGEKTPIDEFLLNVRHIYNKEIVIPSSSLIEINRHKDEGEGKRALSSRGIKNIRMLKMASDYGIIDFSTTGIPSEFDNRVHPDTGATDFAILQAAEDSGILLTEDENLLVFAESMSIPNIRTSEVNEVEHDSVPDVAWAIAKSHVINNQISIEDLSEELESRIAGEQTDVSEEVTQSTLKSMVHDWVEKGELVRTSESVEGDRIENLYPGEKISIIPTYSVAMEIAEGLEEPEFSEGKYLPKEILENIRRAIGGLQTHELPYLEFQLPERYIYRAEEVSQIGSFFKLAQAKNAGYNCISVEGDRDLEQAAILLAKKSGNPILCEGADNSIYKMANLLGVKAAQFR